MTDVPATSQPPQRRVLLPEVPVVTADWTAAAVLDPGGEISVRPAAGAAQRLARERPILCHGPATAARQGAVDFAIHLGLRSIPSHLDLPHPSAP